MHNLWQSHESALQLTVPCRADAEHTERALIQRVLNGDRGAYREFEERYRNLIHAVLHRHHVCAQDHDDIYQELYVRLWAQEQRRLRLWQTTGVGTFKSYLIAVVRNLICDWYRSYPATLIAIGSASPAADAARMTDADPTYFNGKRSIDFDGRLLRNERMNAVREAMTGLPTRDA